jgi:hypothetical protein
MAQAQFNFFVGGITNKKPDGVTTLDTVIGRIRSDTFKEQVLAIREQTSKKAADFFKKDLDYVTFSGTFSPTRLAANLKNHSGFIVVDFDHIADVAMLRIHFQADPYVAACFVSPSGKGLKCVVKCKVDAQNHKAVFADLAAYFNNVYRLSKEEQVDVSGSDPSRACFLSWDPDAWLNPEPKTYTIKTTMPPKPRTEAQQLTDVSETERHLAAVVERIETHKMDICGEYSSEWLLIAFCLSTLGEAGRGYFHRVSALSEKYDEKDADAKFDNAIATSRFTTPWKFFQIAKDYGVDVSKPKRETAQSSTPTPPDQKGVVAKKAGKKSPTDMETWNETTVIYREDGGIIIKAGKHWENVAPNFQLFVKYKTEDEQENVTWVLEVKMTDGRNEFIEVLHDEFCSARKLKNILATKQIGFKLKDSHLDELQSYLFTQTEFNTAAKVIRYGYHVPSSVYFFANVAFNVKKKQLLTPDAFSIVAANGLHLSMPVQTKIRQARYELTDQKVSYGDFWKYYNTAHGYENSFLPACFYIFSLFRDLGVRYKNFSPILFLKGGAGTGKSSMVRILTAGFGRKQDGVNLKSKNTEAALVKLMSQTSNAVTWFDEFHNEFQHEGLLQAAYDNDGYHKSTADFNSIDTSTVEIHSALALTSNYIPDNPIFFSRCVFVPISNQEKSDVQRTAYQQLEEIQERGLGHMTVELLTYREDLEMNDNYLVSYNRLYKALKKRFDGQQVAERLYANLAQIMAAPLTLHCFGRINMLPEQADSEDEILEEFVRIGEMYIMRQWRIQNESKSIAEFFEIIQMLFDAGQIHDEYHFRFDGAMVKLHFPKLYNLFQQKYRQLFYKSAPDRDTIQTELTTLAGLSDWQQMQKSIRFMNDGTGSSQATTIPEKRACELEYSKLEDLFGLNLKHRPTLQ